MGIQKIEDLLNSVDYSTLDKYVPSDFALSFLNFITAINQQNPESHPTPIVHLKAIDDIASMKKHILFLCQRGFSKSTLMEYLMLWCATFNYIPNYGEITGIVSVFDTMDNGAANCRQNLEFKYNHSPYLQSLFDEVKFTEKRIWFKNKNKGELTIRLFGADTGVRGTRMQGDRPQLAILDDLMTNNSAKSPTIVASIKETIYKSVEYALDPSKSKIIMCGTPFNRTDPIIEAAESGAWAVSLFPVCEKFPCEKKDFKGDWEERFSYEIVKEKYDTAVMMNEQASFQQEMMLRINADDSRLVTDADIQWYSRRDLITHKEYYNFYITTDFAVSEKQSADWTVLTVWALNKNRDWFLVDGFIGKVTSNIWIDKLFSLVQKYEPMGVAVETTGQQKGFIPWFREKMMTTNIWFNFCSMVGRNEPGIQPSTNKLARFNKVLPLFKAHKMYFPEELKKELLLQEYLDELSLATINGFKGHDDCLDNISQLGYISVWEPSNDRVIDETLKKQEPDLIYSNSIEPEDITNTNSSMGSYIV